jgi:hypothetical protein
MSVNELIPQARELAAREGGVPAKDRLMKAFRIGRPKATEIHERLTAEVKQRRDRGRRAMRSLQARKGSAGPARLRPYRLLSAPELPAAPVSPAVEVAQVAPVVEGQPREMTAPFPVPSEGSVKRAATWPVVLLAMPAFVAIWSGWVDLGRLTGFGVVHPLPGIADEVALNTAITLPIGLETYAAYALYVWLSGAVPARARQFARRSAVGALMLGAGGQVAYHLMIAAGMARAPWWITTVVACLPVAVLGMGAALRHLVHAGEVK